MCPTIMSGLDVFVPGFRNRSEKKKCAFPMYRLKDVCYEKPLPPVDRRSEYNW